MEKPTQFHNVLEFHETYGAHIQQLPKLPKEDIRKLRFDLLEEEWQEYVEAEKENDLVGIADALADMIYIINGTAVSYGIPLNEIFSEVHSSNMSKLGEDGKPIYREDGKVLKGPNYFRPNIKAIIEKHLDR